MFKSIVVFLCVTFSVNSYCQVVNGYAKVNSITGSTLLSVSSVDEVGDTFEDGEFVIIMQVQDDVIGGNINDNLSFGNLGSINSAGLYEVGIIASHTETSGLPTTITLVNTLNETYNINPNSSVQLITFPTLGSPDYTTTTNMLAKGWNGNVGGVIAFNVNGTLTIAHSITASGAGFNGAVANGGSSTGCVPNSNYRVPFGVNSANKGEGIYKISNANYAAGRARVLNGGGGGNSHNAGGGGGGNFSVGGIGGLGWNCNPTAGGMGGLDLSAHISSNRIFFGGGGGAGEGNNGFGRQGENGGGIIFIKAIELKTTICGSGVMISADGNSSTLTSNNDGNGGGGAGGSIVFEVDSWNLAAACPLTVTNNGGDGGDVGHSGQHGGGAGGGLGAILFSSTVPTSNILIENSPGAGGANCFTCTSAPNGGGTNGSGILTLGPTPLPIELIDFKAILNSNLQVDIKWTTFTEINNDFYSIERSIDAKSWDVLIEKEGAGNTTTILDYHTLDVRPLFGVSYYRLKQTDFDGSYTYSEIRSVNLDRLKSKSSTVYPNPATNLLMIEGEGLSKKSITIFNSLGQSMNNNFNFNEVSYSHSVLNIEGLPSGIYYLSISSEVIRFCKL